MQDAAVHGSSRVPRRARQLARTTHYRGPRHDFDARAFTRALYPVGRNHIVPVNVFSCDCRLSLAERGFALGGGKFCCRSRLVECRLGRVMIDPRFGLHGDEAWAVVDHHEREES